MAIIKVKNIGDIKLPTEPTIRGGNGEIYQYTPLLYFKKISQEQGRLSIQCNLDRLEILIKIMEMKKSKYLIRPQDIFVTR